MLSQLCYCNNIIKSTMRALTLLGLGFFYLHWVAVFIFTLVCNVFKLLWKKVAQSNSDKQHLTLFEATHDHVFAYLYDFISAEGFGLETFSFQTTDKANLQIWRVFKKDTPLLKPYPILLMHGLLDCSTSWFLQADKQKCLPYILAAEGYQVWVGNNRGNRVSQKEEHADQKFWDFNLDHLVDFDQLTMIEGVLQSSGKDKLIYVGHSQGSTQFLLGMGAHQHLHEKIAGFVGLGTVVSMDNLEDHLILKVLSKFKLLELCNWIGFKRILILPHLLSRAFGVLVYNYNFYHDMTMLFVRLLCGFSVKNKIPKDYFGVMLTHEPGGASSNNTLQWVQCYRNGDMRRFDYGTKKNLEVYGSEEPKAYCLKHLENLPFKSYLFKGTKDAVMSHQCFEKLASLFNPEKIKTYELDDYHHLQYLWSESAHHDLYPQVLKIIQQCSQI